MAVLLQAILSVLAVNRMLSVLAAVSRMIEVFRSRSLRLEGKLQ